MQVSIYTEKTELVQNEFDEIILPTGDGEITILNHHTPLLGILKRGEIILKTKSEKIKINVNKGFFYVKNNKLVIIITNTNLTEQELEKTKEIAIKLATNKIMQEKISEEAFKKMKDTTPF